MRFSLIVCAVLCVLMSAALLAVGNKAQIEALDQEVTDHAILADGSDSIAQDQLQLSEAVSRQIGPQTEQSRVAAPTALIQQISNRGETLGDSAASALVLRMTTLVTELSEAEQRRRQATDAFATAVAEIAAQYRKVTVWLDERQARVLDDLATVSASSQEVPDGSASDLDAAASDADAALRRVIGDFVREQTQAAVDRSAETTASLTIARIRQLEWTVAGLLEEITTQRQKTRERTLQRRADAQKTTQQAVLTRLAELKDLIALQQRVGVALGLINNLQPGDLAELATLHAQLLEQEQGSFQAAFTLLEPVSALLDTTSVQVEAMLASDAKRRRTAQELSALNSELMMALDAGRRNAFHALATRVRERLLDDTFQFRAMLALLMLSLASLILAVWMPRRTQPAAATVADNHVSQPLPQMANAREQPAKTAEVQNVPAPATPKTAATDISDRFEMELDTVQDRLTSLRETLQPLRDAVTTSLRTYAADTASDDHLTDAIKASENAKIALDSLARQANAISSLATKSRYLALNASIEASHAGAYGSGFAVVAGEMRKLAEKSGETSVRMQEVSTQAVSSVAEAHDSIVLASADGAEPHALRDPQQSTDQVLQALDKIDAQTAAIATALDQLKAKATLTEIGQHMSATRVQRDAFVQTQTAAVQA